MCSGHYCSPLTLSIVPINRSKGSYYYVVASFQRDSLLPLLACKIFLCLILAALSFFLPSVSGLLCPVDQHINTSLFLPWKTAPVLKSFYWERLNNLHKTSKRAGEKTTPLNLAAQFSTFMDTRSASIDMRFFPRP